MQVNEDRRVRMTKKILKQSLIEIMKTKHIHEISIKKICEIADVNRSTFYHHYQSPQELYDDIINDITKAVNEIITKSIEKKVNHVVIFSELLSYIENNRNLFLVILSDKGNISIGERLSGLLNQFIGVNNDSELSMYCAQFISAGVANILWLWLNNEKRLPPNEVAGLISAIMLHGVKNAFLFSSKEGRIIK